MATFRGLIVGAIVAGTPGSRTLLTLRPGSL
jgi:hypothetical protein